MKLLLYGIAAIVDTAVLLVVIERRNWPRVMLPLVLLVAGVWVYHVGAFAHVILADTGGRWAAALQWAAMSGMATGLALQPSAALHAWWRLGHAGFEPRATADRRGIAFYLPMLLLVPAMVALANAPHAPFLESLAAWVTPYLAWWAVANLVAGVGSLRLRRRFSDAGERSFLTTFGVALLVLAGIEVGIVLLAAGAYPAWRDTLIAFATVAPVLLTLVLALAIVRFQIMGLVLQRTVVYAALVVGAVLLHRVVLVDLWSDLSDRYHLDFVLLEGALLVALVVIWRPLRERVAEALHYLLGDRIAETRVEARRLALEMAAMFGERPERIVDWFRPALAAMLRAPWAAVWLLEPESGEAEDTVRLRNGPTDRLSDERVVALYAALREHGMTAAQRSDAPTRAVARALAETEASLVVALRHPSARGLVLVGRRSRVGELVGEQVAAVGMLVEQLGVTLNNAELQAQRSAAERRALQNEKLSTLGLVASSIAHEVKNPLSSIKTLASVLGEDATPDSDQAKDLRLIVEEVDRLSASVNAILTFARPSETRSESARAERAVDGTLHIMRHVAKQHGVHLKIDVEDGLPEVRADPDAVREVVFNLLANAIRAAGVDGDVGVAVRQEQGQVVIEIRDSGPGIATELQDRIYEPFVSGSVDGTGLGLYVVSRRVRDVGGEIHCDSRAGQGTVFTVRLPVAESATEA